MSQSNITLCETHMLGEGSREWIVGPNAKESLALYGIVLAGTSQAASGFRFVRMAPKFSQALVCHAGAGMALVAGEWVRCESGTAYITPPNVVHGYYALPGLPWRTSWVIFSQDWKKGLEIGAKSPTLIRVDPRPIGAAIDALYLEVNGKAEPVVIQHWAFLVNAYAQRCLTPAPRLRAVWDAVQAEISRPWTLGDLALIAGMSAEQLRRISRLEVHNSPIRFVTELRMREAAALLASAAYTVEEVADRVGYSDPFAFSTAFKRTYGTPPSEYHRSVGH